MTRCSTCLWPNSPIVTSPERRKGALVAAIGEGPASEEAARGQCFVGPSGRELDKTLMRAGVSREEVAIENAHGCWRKEDNPFKLVKAVDSCRGRLASFLSETQPRTVALLGGSALRSVCPAFVSGAASDGLLRHRGSLWHRREIEAANQAVGEENILPESVEWVVATIHPAAIIGRERIEKFSSMAYRTIPALDIKRLVETLRRKGRKTVEVNRIESTPPFTNEPFIFDIETRGKWNRNVEWIGIQHLDGGSVYSGPWSEMREWTKAAMRSKVLKVGHNVNGFDIPILFADGIEVSEPWGDTMTAAGICESDMARGLFFQQALYAGDMIPFHKELTCDDNEDKWKIRRTIGLRAAWEETNLLRGERVLEGQWAADYNALDCVATGIVWRAQQMRMKTEGWTV